MARRKIAGCVFGCIMGSIVLSAPVLAAESKDKSIKPETITCEEFLVLGKDVQPHVVYWIEGYSKAGTVKEKGVVIHEFERPITVVVNECKKTPKETLWQKIKNFF